MYLYILENTKNHIFYIGTTKNPERRLKEHNRLQRHFTGKLRGEWKYIFKKRYNSCQETRREEHRLKRAKNKRYLRWYIGQYGSVA